MSVRRGQSADGGGGAERKGGEGREWDGGKEKGVAERKGRVNFAVPLQKFLRASMATLYTYWSS